MKEISLMLITLLVLFCFQSAHGGSRPSDLADDDRVPPTDKPTASDLSQQERGLSDETLHKLVDRQQELIREYGAISRNPNLTREQKIAAKNRNLQQQNELQEYLQKSNELPRTSSGSDPWLADHVRRHQSARSAVEDKWDKWYRNPNLSHDSKTSQKMNAWKRNELQKIDNAARQEWDAYRRSRMSGVSGSIGNPPSLIGGSSSQPPTTLTNLPTSSPSGTGKFSFRSWLKMVREWVQKDGKEVAKEVLKGIALPAAPGNKTPGPSKGNP